MTRLRAHLKLFFIGALTLAAVGVSLRAQTGQGAVAGVVKDAITGAPIAGALVTVGSVGITAVSDGSGVYAATVPAGIVTLTVSAPGRPSQSVFGVLVKNGATSMVNFAVANPGAIGATGTLTGFVRNAETNAPIANAIVTVSPGGTPTATDANGRYELSLLAGTYTVSASAAFYEPLSIPGVVVSRQTVTTRSLQLSPARGSFEVLHVFASTADGESPGALIQATDGNFYGTAFGNGDLGLGTIFKMTPAGTFTVLHGFSGGSDGANPYGLIQGAHGDFYGIASASANSDAGGVFKMSAAGDVTMLHVFGQAGEGAYPAALIQGRDGDIYGTTTRGGPSEFGTVFKMTPGGIVTVLHAFSDGADGADPNGGLVEATDGNFYGTTYVGGSSDQGTVFKMTPDGTVTILHAFTGGSDAAYPLEGLIQASDGNFYGSTYGGGSSNGGTIYRITPAGDVTVLHSFFYDDPNRLLQGTDGNIYGSTFGDIYDFDGGAIFRITPDGTFSILHTFALYTTGVSNPCGLTQGTDGNLYGTTCYGGIPHEIGRGTIFRLTIPKASNTARTASVLVRPKAPAPPKTGTTGHHDAVTKVSPGAESGLGTVTGVVTDALTRAPIAGALVTISPGGHTATTDAAGVYQTTVPAGTFSLTVSAQNRPLQSAFGVVVKNGATTTVNFRLASSAGTGGTGILRGSVRKASTNAPVANAIVSVSPGGNSAATDANGRYELLLPAGTYTVSVSASCAAVASASGIVIASQAVTTRDLQLSLSPPDAVVDVLHRFASATDGENPIVLIQARDGDLYGMTVKGGDLGGGTIFKMTQAGALTLVHQFEGADGQPTALIQGTDGDLYGLAGDTVFEMTLDGTVNILHTFAGDVEGYPRGLIQGADGDFYGTTQGAYPSEDDAVFRMTLDGTVTILHTFTGSIDGRLTGLIRGADGNLYGTTFSFAGPNYGTVFAITPAGVVTVLHTFTGGPSSALFNLIQGSDGNFYGMTGTLDSGANGFTISRITPAGDVTVLHSSIGFDYSRSLIQATDGNFYGTQYGIPEEFNGGSIFRMTAAGEFTYLQSFSILSAGGSNPFGGLVQGAGGNFYGITFWGGIPHQDGAGTIFRLRVSACETSTAISTQLEPGRPKVSRIASAWLRSSLAGNPGATNRVGRDERVAGTAAFADHSFPRTTGSPRAASQAGAPHTRVWEIEAFGGATFASQPGGGNSTLPPAGAPFVTAAGQPSRRVSSWYLSDGAQLLNGVNAALGVSQQITPLDAALGATLGERPSGGGGVRVSRWLTPRLTAEVTVDFDAVRADLSNEASAAIEASRVSFLSAWESLASAGQFGGTVVTSVGTVQIHDGHQIVATGAVNVALRKTGNLIPYVTGGAGVIFNSGTSVSADLVGDYRFTLGGVTSFHETDSVTVRYTVADQAVVGVLGAGFKYLVSPHVGMRVDYRTYLGANGGTTFLNSNPSVSTLAPAGSAASATTPGIQFSNDPSIGIQSSLSGPRITDFRTCDGSGVQRRGRLTMGLFWRF